MLWNASPKMAMLAKQCVDEDPVLRPDMKQVVIALSQILLSSIEWESTQAGNSQVFSGLVAGRWSGHTGPWCCSRCSSLHILLVPCPVEQFLGFFWENIYHSALYLLVGGTVCSYVCIQESTMQCNVRMSPCVVSFVLLMLCTGLCVLCQNRKAKLSSSCGCNALVIANCE